MTKPQAYRSTQRQIPGHASHQTVMQGQEIKSTVSAELSITNSDDGNRGGAGFYYTGKNSQFNENVNMQRDVKNIEQIEFPLDGASLKGTAASTIAKFFGADNSRWEGNGQIPGMNTQQYSSPNGDSATFIRSLDTMNYTTDRKGNVIHSTKPVSTVPE